MSERVVAVLLVALCCACAPKPRAPEVDHPDVTLHGVTLRTWRGSRPSAIGQAETVTYERGPGTAVATKARILLADGGTTLTAPTVEGSLPAQTADAKGGVRLESSNGLRGRTPSVHFDGATRTARGDQGVEVTGPGYTLQAPRFDFDFQEQALDFEGGVRSHLGKTPR